MIDPPDANATIAAVVKAYPLHSLGWKAFQDLAVAVAEECLRRPVQNFLPNSDAGRDGAFIGRWEGADPAAGESTIQCKFTSRPNFNLSLSMLTDELEKARTLAAKRLATDYIILTNHPVTGASELQIKAAFEAVGVGRCRVFGADWIIRQIRASPRLRIMVPRLYGLGDLSELLDTRAYMQAQLILSALGDDLQRLVVTDAHRKSVRAISEHNLVLLLGAPAAGKSTIGASLAIGAADIWQSGTIRATSPEDIQRHLNPGIPQFFWIDDAWGNTQYQRQTAEAWNQVFPLMQGALRKGTRFLLTSRDYIWRAAQRDLKLQSIPILSRSQVIINVQELSTQEKAQILYNHLKLGDQPMQFRTSVKPFLPELAELQDFLPETARRLGSKFFTDSLAITRNSLVMFFERPANFLLDTISNLSADCRAAIAVLFMNGGKVNSPVAEQDLAPAASAFGVTPGAARDQLEALNGSLLLMVQGETGLYWTYKHPTISDAFAAYVARSPELVDVYLRGAKAESIVHEVVCAGISVSGALVIVPNSLHRLLADRIAALPDYQLSSFLSYRSNRDFSQLLLELQPELLSRITTFATPIKEDVDASMMATLHKQGLLPEDIRLRLVDALRRAAVEDADSSFLDDSDLGDVLNQAEKSAILEEVETNVIANIDHHVKRVRDDWDKDYSPKDHFDNLETALESFVSALADKTDYSSVLHSARAEIRTAIGEMNEDYEVGSAASAPTASPSRSTPLANLFRDIDE